MVTPQNEHEKDWVRVYFSRTRRGFYVITWVAMWTVILSLACCQQHPYSRPAISSQTRSATRETRYGWPLPYVRIVRKSSTAFYSPQGIAVDAITSVLVLLCVVVTVEQWTHAYVKRSRIGLQSLFVLTFVFAGMFTLSRLKMGDVLYELPIVLRVIMVASIFCLNYAVIRSFLAVAMERGETDCQS